MRARRPDDRNSTASLARYDAALRERGMVDLDDLVTLPAALLAGDPALAEAYRERWTDVFVDEYQDVDEQQYLCCGSLPHPARGSARSATPTRRSTGSAAATSATSCGSPRTSAPAERRAATVRLSRSYRSAPTIVRAAMQLIRPGTLVPGRELIPARTDIPDGPVVLHAVADEREEAEAVAAEIEKLLGAASFHALDSRAVDGRDRAEHQLSFADFAVLYRTSAQAAAVQRGAGAARLPVPAPRALPAGGDAGRRRDPGPAGPFRHRNAPAVSAAVGAAVAVEHRHREARCGADAYAAATAIGAERSLCAARRCGVGAAMPRLAGGAVRRPALAIRAAADVLGPLAARCGSDLDRFLDELALGAEVDTWDPRADRISLLTLHAAKGLEFPVVFIVGCDDGLLPLRSWRGAEVDYAEERRLLFVGMTRATTRLTLLTAAKRTLRGEVTECTPSPFLASVDPALLDARGDGGAARARRKARVQQPALF